MSLVTVPQAAQILELSEGQINRAIERGELEVVDRGAWNRKMLDETAVRTYGIHRNIGQGAKSQRQIILVGTGLEEIERSVVAAGLIPVEASGLLDAMRAGDARGFPIMLSTIRVVENEQALLKPLLAEVAMMIVVKNVWRVPPEIEPRVVLADPTEHRRITHWCWGQVRRRHEAITLGL